MSHAEFMAALKRNGFEKTLMWCRDVSGETSTSYGCVYSRSGKLLRRVTLAHVIQSRNKDISKTAHGEAAAS